MIGSARDIAGCRGDVTPGISVMFSIVFKNLGEIGGNVLSVAGGSVVLDVLFRDPLGTSPEGI